MGVVVFNTQKSKNYMADTFILINPQNFKPMKISGCLHSLDWITGMDYWTGTLDYIQIMFIFVITKINTGNYYCPFRPRPFYYLTRQHALFSSLLYFLAFYFLRMAEVRIVTYQRISMSRNRAQLKTCPLLLTRLLMSQIRSKLLW